MKSIEELISYNKIAKHNLKVERHLEVEQAAANVVSDYLK